MRHKILFFALSLTICSCKDIFEQDLSKEAVQINSPGNNTVTNTYSQLFWWAKLDDALNYNLQIASPTFDSNGSLLYDTTTSATKVIVSLKPGYYQWRVKAMNGSSSTPYTTYSFKLDTASLTTQIVTLLSPVNNFLSNLTQQQLEWQGLYGADQYRIIIDSVSSSSNHYLDTTITSSALDPVFNYTFDTQVNFNKSYYWKVIAVNGSKSSLPSEIRKFELDITKPDSVTMPLTLVQVSGKTSLSWGIPTDTDIAYYRVYVFKDDGFTSYFANPIYKVVTSPNYDFTSAIANDKCYWTVEAVDNAGNVGLRASKRSFIFK